MFHTWSCLGFQARPCLSLLLLDCLLLFIRHMHTLNPLNDKTANKRSRYLEQVFADLLNGYSGGVSLSQICITVTTLTMPMMQMMHSGAMSVAPSQSSNFTVFSLLTYSCVWLFWERCYILALHHCKLSKDSHTKY